MVKRASWPVAVAPVGPVVVGSTLWQVQGQTMVTVIVKATMTIPAEGSMTLVEPEPLRVVDEHESGQPTGSLVGPCETAPLLQRVDVVVTGHAYGAEGATDTTVRLMIAGDAGTVLDKALAVVGDRNEDGAPRPVGKLKLGYERAFGGIGFADNPLGTGYGADAARPPNIVYPGDAGDRTAGFGAIPASFPGRKRLLGDTPRSALSQPVASIPEGFDWAYFQAAPEDQRLDALQGNEWLLLDGLHPTQPRLRAQLPGVTALARIYGHDQAGAPDGVPLRIDMLHIDADAQRCSLVWRGSFPVARVEHLADLVIAAGVQASDEPLVWPETVAELEDASRPATSPVAAVPEATPSDQTVAMDAGGAPDGDELFGGTVAMDAGDVASHTLPFADRPGGAPPPPKRAQPEDPTVMPFKSGAPAPSSPAPPGGVPASPGPGGSPFEGTVALDASQVPEPEASPFAIAPAGKAAPGGGAGPAVRGTPWDKAGADGAEPAPPGPAASAGEAPPPPAVPARVGAEQQAALAADAAEQAAAADAARAAEQSAKLEAERQAQAELEVREKAETEEKARLVAEAHAAAEAEERRRAAAEAFQKEQEEARKERERLKAEKAKAKRKAAKTLRQDMYGAFKRKK